MKVQNSKTQLDQLKGLCASPYPSMGQLSSLGDLENYQDFDNCQNFDICKDVG